MGKYIRKRGNEIHIGEWYTGWHTWNFEITYQTCSYESPNAAIYISLFGWMSVFRLPFKSKKFPYGDCCPPTYGIEIHDNTFWIMRGGGGNLGGGDKWWTWDLPFFTYEHVRHEVETIKDGEVSMTNYNNLNNVRDENGRWIPLEDNPEVNVHTCTFTDKYDGAQIATKYWVEEREWRPKWLTWTSKFAKVKKYIEINFAEEVGRRKGSWKGGVMGCSYDLLPGETAEECIRRMEVERDFR